MFPDEPALQEKNGAVYTKPWVVEMILDLCGYTSDANLVDAVAMEPAAGAGVFVCAMARRLVSSCRRQGRPILDCRDSLIVRELIESSAEETRTRTLAALRAMGVLIEDAEMLTRTWIAPGDYLSEGSSLPKADFVIGNPPYIRLEDVNSSIMAQYRSGFATMKGRSDIYIGFYEAALTQLKPNGVCGFICADRWMLNQYGTELRRHITSQFSVETIIEMHTAGAFESDVSAYPAVTVIRRQMQKAVVVASINENISPSMGVLVADSLSHLRETGHLVNPISGMTAGRFDTWFSKGEPWPCTSPERLMMLKYLEQNFPPLESFGTRVGIGVASGADNVFITTRADTAEASRMLPLALASDVAGGKLEWSGHYLVDPWSPQGLVNLAQHPLLSAYYRRHETRLLERNVGKRNPAAWYRTIDRVNHDLLGKRKLYIPDIKSRIFPVLDDGKTYPHHNLYFIESEQWDLEVLGGLLLSDVAQFFVECYGVRMRGGYLRFQAQYLRKIRIPNPSDIPEHLALLLKEAFRARDVRLATSIAQQLYRIDQIPAGDYIGN